MGAEAEDEGQNIFFILHFHGEDCCVLINGLNGLVLSVDALLDEHGVFAGDFKLYWIPLAVLLHAEFVDEITLVICQLYSKRLIE